MILITVISTGRMKRSFLQRPLVTLLSLFLFGADVMRITAQPSNDDCSNAIPLTVNGATETGTTVEATASPFCGGGTRIGVWYSAVGTGRIMTLSTCGDETDFASALSAQGNCGSSAGDEEPGFVPPCTNPFGATHTFDSVANQVYNFQVRGVSETDAGNFAISLVDYESPPNDDCSNAIPLVVNGPAQVGTTVISTRSPFCGGGTRRGVWYSAIGTGNIMTISTCGTETDYPSALNTQGACGSSCVANEEPGFVELCVNPFGATHTFDSVANQVYNFNVRGVTNSDVGKFAISLVDYESPPNNDCSNAIQLTVNGPAVVGTTENSTRSPFCGGGTRRGVWYTAVGTGKIMSVSTCGAETDYSSVISTQRACGTSCVSNEDPGFVPVCTNPFGSTHTFDSVANEAYNFHIHGAATNSEIGTFSVSVVDYLNPPNDDCANAIQLTINEQLPTIGTTVNATKSPFCGGGTRRGVWYVVQGNGRNLTSSTCSSATNFASRQILQTGCGTSCLLSGTPGDLECPSTSAFSSRITWLSEASQSYYINVIGASNSDVGNFGIQVVDDTFVAVPTPEPVVTPAPTLTPSTTPPVAIPGTVSPTASNMPNLGSSFSPSIETTVSSIPSSSLSPSIETAFLSDVPSGMSEIPTAAPSYNPSAKPSADPLTTTPAPTSGSTRIAFSLAPFLLLVVAYFAPVGYK